MFRTNEDLGPVPKGSLIYSGKFGAFATLGTSPISPVKTNYGAPSSEPPPEAIGAVTVGQVSAGILDAQGIADWGRSITFSPHKDAGQMKACQGQ